MYLNYLYRILRLRALRTYSNKRYKSCYYGDSPHLLSHQFKYSVVHSYSPNYGAINLSSLISSSLDNLARVRICMMMVPAVRGEMLMGGIWHREQFAWNTASPSVLVEPAFDVELLGFDPSSLAVNPVTLVVASIKQRNSLVITVPSWTAIAERGSDR